MPVTYPLVLPDDNGIAQITFSMINVVGLSQSPFTLKSQTIKYSGEAWTANVALPPLKRDMAEQWVVFLASLKGKYGTFLMGDPNGLVPRGSAAVTPGSPIVSGALQTGETINIAGAPASRIGYLLKGDYVQFGSGLGASLHKVLEDVNTTAGGLASLTVWPSVTRSPANSSPVVVNSAKGLFRLSYNENSFSINQISSYGLAFDCMEVKT